MQFLVQRLDLFPKPGCIRLELGGTHVEAGTPHFAEVAVAKFSCTFVYQFNIALVGLAHRWSNRSPAVPVLQQLIVVATGLHQALELGPGNTVIVIATIFSGAVHALEFGCDQRELLALGGIRGCRQRRAEFQQIDRTPGGRVDVLPVIGQRLLHHLAVPLGVTLARGCCEDRRVLGDVRCADPLGRTNFFRQVLEFGIGTRHEFFSRFRRRSRRLVIRCLFRASRHQDNQRQACHQFREFSHTSLSSLFVMNASSECRASSASESAISGS